MGVESPAFKSLQYLRNDDFLQHYFLLIIVLQSGLDKPMDDIIVTC